jgi:hypothetical protein
MYCYVSDRDFLLRAALSNFEYLPFDKIIYHYKLHPGSITLDGNFDGEADYMFETRTLIEEYIQNQDIPNHVHKHLLTWHSDILSGQLISALKRKDLYRAISYVREGYQMNSYWIDVFMNRLTRALSHRVTKLLH